MKSLIFISAIFGFSFGFPMNSYIVEDGVESIIIQCGENPDGVWECVRYELEDDSDCLVIAVEGAETIFDGC